MRYAATAILLILFCPDLSFAQHARAHVDRTHVSLEDTIRLTVAIDGDGGEVDVSGIRDFSVHSSGSTSSMQIVNGNVSRETIHNYTLIPKKEGRLIIPPLSVRSGGKIYHTRRINITVSKSPRAGQQTRNVFVRAHVSNPNPFVGEQIVYTFRLYFKANLELADVTRPGFEGFAAQEIDERVPYSKRKSYQQNVGGIQYNVSDLFRFVLVPTGEGEKTIDPMILNCGVVYRERRGRPGFDSIFGDPFTRKRVEQKVLRSKPIRVNVKPLPPYEGPGEFSGLVGRLDFRAELDPQALKTGDSATLSMTVEGKGNLMDMDEPKIRLPEQFKVYKDSPEEEITLGASGYSGKKVYRMALVPVEKGEYTLDPIRLTWFDVFEKKYKTAGSGPLAITVNPSDKKEELEVFSTNGEFKPFKKRVEFTGRDILPLKEDLSALETAKPMSVIVFVLLLLAPVAVFLATKAAVSCLSADGDPAAVMAERAEKSLRQAETESSPDRFQSHLYHALVSAVLSKAGTKGESLTYSEVGEILRSNGFPEETAKDAAKLLEKIESAKFSGLSLDENGRAELLAETKRMTRGLM